MKEMKELILAGAFVITFAFFGILGIIMEGYK